MFYDYRTNVDLYPKWQELFRTSAPPTLIVWGKNDVIFPGAGAAPYKKDIKDLEVHMLNTGHFALEEKASKMIPLIRDFLNRKINLNK
jgi:pimeloyl-ACP methyl ester carboxylesterase